MSTLQGLIIDIVIAAIIINIIINENINIPIINIDNVVKVILQVLKKMEMVDKDQVKRKNHLMIIELYIKNRYKAMFITLIRRLPM